MFMEQHKEKALECTHRKLRAEVIEEEGGGHRENLHNKRPEESNEASGGGQYHKYPVAF